MQLHRDRKRHPRIYLEGYNAYPETCRSKNPYDNGNWRDNPSRASMASAWDLGWEAHQIEFETQEVGRENDKLNEFAQKFMP